MAEETTTNQTVTQPVTAKTPATRPLHGKVIPSTAARAAGAGEGQQQPAAGEKSGGGEGAAKAVQDGLKQAGETPEQKAARAKAQMDALNLRRQREKEEKIRQDAAAADELRQLQDLSKKDREAFLKKMGIDPHGFALDWLEKQGAEKVPPTTDKKVEELEAKLKEYDERWKKREEQDQQRQVQDQVQQSQKLVKDFLTDSKHGDRYEAINAEEEWETVREAAIRYVQREKLSVSTKEELDEVLALAADAVEESLVEKAKKLAGLKKLGIKLPDEAKAENKDAKKEEEKPLGESPEEIDEWMKGLSKRDQEKLMALKKKNRPNAVGAKGMRPGPQSTISPRLNGEQKVKDFLVKHGFAK